MPRQMNLSHHPIIEPGVCGKCGTQNCSWFLDLGFDTIFNYVNDQKLNTWTDGVVYLCADCCNSLFQDLFTMFQIYQRDEKRELTPLKMIPITLDKKEADNGDSGPSSGVDLGNPEDVDSDVEPDGLDDENPARAFRISLAEAV